MRLQVPRSVLSRCRPCSGELGCVAGMAVAASFSSSRSRDERLGRDCGRQGPGRPSLPEGPVGRNGSSVSYESPPRPPAPRTYVPVFSSAGASSQRGVSPVLQRSGQACTFTSEALSAAGPGSMPGTTIPPPRKRCAYSFDDRSPSTVARIRIHVREGVHSSSRSYASRRDILSRPIRGVCPYVTDVGRIGKSDSPLSPGTVPVSCSGDTFDASRWACRYRTARRTLAPDIQAAGRSGRTSQRCGRSLLRCGSAVVAYECRSGSASSFSPGQANEIHA
jgi:hypothetical protein